MRSDETECLFSGLPMGTCAHCLGHDDPPPIYDHDDDWEITAVFDSLYSSRCTIDSEHVIRRGDRVGKVQHEANPMMPVPGVACGACVRTYPRAKR